MHTHEKTVIRFYEDVGAANSGKPAAHVVKGEAKWNGWEQFRVWGRQHLLAFVWEALALKALFIYEATRISSREGDGQSLILTNASGLQKLVWV